MDSVKFTLEQIVFHKVKTGERGMITGIFFRPDAIHYYVTWSDMNEKMHYACELTTEPNYIERNA